MNVAIGRSVTRVDGPAKVTGTACYAAEFQINGMAHAALVLSTISSGRIVALETAAAEEAPGVIAVISHKNAPDLPYHERDERPPVDPQAGQQLRVFQGNEILFSGQPVAVVVAETTEEADYAASLIEIGYEPSEAALDFVVAQEHAPSEESAESGRPGETEQGEADNTFARAPVCVDVTFLQPREHHNAIEPHATVATWDGDHLTLYDKSQWPYNDRAEIAHVFGMPERNIRVVSPFVGGAFGSALRTWPHVAIAALAAREVGRPVRLELTRRQLYTSIGFRPETGQRVALGADEEGKLIAIIHEAVGQTSRYEEYAETTVSATRKAYACPNIRTRYRLINMNTNTPCPMRAPGTVTGALALEMAMDELAVALHMDPVELRLRNYADHDQAQGLPWSSNELRICYRTAAERFGWSRRSPQPGSMREGRDFVGYGMSSSMYHANQAPASASVALFANGTAVVRSASSDMGPGTYTAMSQVAAETLDLPIEAIRFELGDTDFPTAPVHGGSITMASMGNAVAAACEAVMHKLDDLGGGDGDAPFTERLRRHGLDSLCASGDAAPTEESENYSSSAFGAVFVEVRVDPDLGTVRVPRMVGAYDVGRVINPLTARSQCIGGMVGGLGMALMEEAEWDERFGRVMNSNLAEYLVPVCADVQELDVTFVPSDDRKFNPIGAKGLAELSICGVAPAIANAVYHATGKRIREMPITLDKMLA